jgi:hypothetical protein
MTNSTNLRIGLYLVLGSIAVILVGILGVFGGAVMLPISMGLAFKAMTLGAVAMVASPFLGVLGKLLCMSAPTGRSLVGVSAAMDILAIYLAVVAKSQWNSPVSILASVLFLLFLSQLAVYYDRADLSLATMSVVGLTVGGVAVFIVSGLLSQVVGSLAVVGGLVAIVMLVTAMVRYLKVLLALAKHA